MLELANNGLNGNSYGREEYYCNCSAGNIEWLWQYFGSSSTRGHSLAIIIVIGVVIGSEILKNNNICLLIREGKELHRLLKEIRRGRTVFLHLVLVFLVYMAIYTLLPWTGFTLPKREDLYLRVVLRDIGNVELWQELGDSGSVRSR